MSEGLGKKLVKTDLQLECKDRRDEGLIHGAIRKEIFKLENKAGHQCLRCHTMDIVIGPSDFNAWKRIPAMRVEHGWNFTQGYQWFTLR